MEAHREEASTLGVPLGVVKETNPMTVPVVQADVDRALFGALVVAVVASHRWSAVLRPLERAIQSHSMSRISRSISSRRGITSAPIRALLTCCAG
jgi:hypothetical protein